MSEHGLTFDMYQQRSSSTALYPGAGSSGVPPLMYCALGLTGEAGEIANKVKKLYRDNVPIEYVRSELAKELGDVLWYVSQLALELALPLGHLAEGNLEKLADRARRGVLGGNGDDR